MTGRIPMFTTLVCSLFVGILAGEEAKVARSGDAPFAIPTFNCLGLYWSPPGGGAGQPIPNFSGTYTGLAPDIGAHQRGTPPIQYGIRAGRR